MRCPRCKVVYDDHSTPVGIQMGPSIPGDKLVEYMEGTWTPPEWKPDGPQCRCGECGATWDTQEEYHAEVLKEREDLNKVPDPWEGES